VPIPPELSRKLQRQAKKATARFSVSVDKSLTRNSSVVAKEGIRVGAKLVVLQMQFV